MIVSIILSILKILGITLLCILGFLLVVILLVLFVPIRYKITAEANIGDTDKTYHAKAKVTWLLCLVRGVYEYPGEKGFVLKIGPFTIAGKEEKPKKQKKEKKKNKTKEPIDVQDENDILQEEPLDDTGDDQISDDFDKEAKDVDVFEEMMDEETTKQQRKGLKEKIFYTWQKICDKIKGICNKIKGIFKNIKKYVDIMKSDEFKSAVALCKESLDRIFRMIKPRKVRMKGIVGLKNPEQTGYVCAAVGILSPFYKKEICITPDFENFNVDGNVLIKGRIYLFVVVKIAIKVFFDKNIRKVLELFRREET